MPTTDAWTSPQNISYMCLTAHFIDNDWKLHKKILNFRQVRSHTGEAMAKFVESCLNEWGLNHVLSLTVDNASSNDTGIQLLKKRLLCWNNLVLKGEHIHMRCCAHILNLIVNSGLKEIDNSVLRIRAAVKYIRSSPSRLMSFKECVERQNIEYKGHICLDVETRWNSTYLMLDAALKHRKAFQEFEFHDSKYANELGKGIGLPSCEDWEYVEAILPFLSIFYEATLRISGRFPILSNIARDLLAMPVSTVASESAFSTGGRVLDPFRSSLSHEKVEALICTQDWLKDTPSASLLDFDLEELQNFDKELVSQQDIVGSTTISLEE